MKIQKNKKNIAIGLTLAGLTIFACLFFYDFKSHRKQARVDNLKENILSDSQDRISENFQIPDGLRERVSFWFDIYGRYSSHQKVIHHKDYPWLVFEVVNLKKVVGPKTYMKKRMAFYKKALKKISFNKESLSNEESRIKALFSNFPEEALNLAHKKIRYQTGQKNYIATGLKRSQSYLPHMEKTFERNGLPIELARLPFVESSFNFKAHSKVGAKGIWQFTSRTGRKFLRIRKYYDERLSPMKSTRAAAKLLKQNHKILKGNWSLAVTAYNHGPKGVRKAVEKMGSSDIAVIADNYKSRRFSFASANFYASFLAALHIEKYQKFLFKDKHPYNPPVLNRARLSKRIKAQTLQKLSGMDLLSFKTWNPDLAVAIQKNKVLPRGLTYYLPAKKKEIKMAYKESKSKFKTDMD